MPIFFVDFTGLSRKHVYSAVNEIGVLICSEGIYSRPQNILWVNMVFSFLVVVCMCRVAMHFPFRVQTPWAQLLAFPWVQIAPLLTACRGQLRVVSFLGRCTS